MRREERKFDSIQTQGDSDGEVRRVAVDETVVNVEVNGTVLGESITKEKLNFVFNLKTTL